MLSSESVESDSECSSCGRHSFANTMQCFRQHKPRISLRGGGGNEEDIARSGSSEDAVVPTGSAPSDIYSVPKDDLAHERVCTQCIPGVWRPTIVTLELRGRDGEAHEVDRFENLVGQLHTSVRTDGDGACGLHAV